MKTRSQTIAADVAALLRARNSLLWIVTREEARAERYLFEAAASAGYIARTWDVAQGVADMAGKTEPIGSTDPAETLAAIGERANRNADSSRMPSNAIAPCAPIFALTRPVASPS